MANIMSLVKMQNKPSRNGFDLSRRTVFSAKIGELLPVHCIECIPGDSFKIRNQHFTRTLPVNTAAYTTIREYYDWFFVPTNLLWNKFNTFVTQMTDNNQKAAGINLDSKLTSRHPYFTYSQLYAYIGNLRNEGATSYNFFGYDRAMLTCKLLDYLGYGTYYSAALPDPSADNKYPTIMLDTNTAFNPFPLLAYQKIYQDYYRNSQWEQAYAPACNIDYIRGDNDLQLPIQNIDGEAENMFDLRYANWNKDYFMGVLPNSQYGPEAIVDLSSIAADYTEASGLNIISGSAASIIQTDSAVVQQNTGRLGAKVGSNYSYGWKLPAESISRIAASLGLSSGESAQSAFSILALRQAEAAQKWREITQSTQQDYKSQIEAHFGVNVSDAYSDRCKFISGGVDTIDINEVVNQTLRTEQDQAEIKGKGVGTGDSWCDFDTKVHGYLMCIYHAVPILDYQITGVEKKNLKTMVTDYAIPEFDKTGMVKIPGIELSVDAASIDLSRSQLGYAPQYYEYKTSYDVIKGAFAYGGLQQWVAPFSAQYIDDYFVQLQAMYGDYNIEYHFFKVNPNVLNPIFVQQINSFDFASSETSTDQLLINCSQDIKAVRNIDRNGLPY